MIGTRWTALAALLGACGMSVGTDADTGPGVQDTVVTVDEGSFPCITELSPVRRFYVGNLLGDLEATLDVARAPQGRAYPPGSLLQLVPFEAMVKREAGFSPETDDWEFFFLAAGPEGARIEDRGTTGVRNAFNGDCAACHTAAAGDWDWVCEQDHGCVDLPLTEEAIREVQAADPRCP